MAPTVPPECDGCAMIENCFHLTHGEHSSVCEEARQEREVAKDVEIARLTKALANAEQRYEGAECFASSELDERDALLRTAHARIVELEKETKRLKEKAESGELCPDCGEKAVHLTMYDDRVCSACNHTRLAEESDDEPSESAEEWLGNTSF